MKFGLILVLRDRQVFKQNHHTPQHQDISLQYIILQYANNRHFNTKNLKTIDL